MGEEVEAGAITAIQGLLSALDDVVRRCIAHNKVVAVASQDCQQKRDSRLAL